MSNQTFNAGDRVIWDEEDESLSFSKAYLIKHLGNGPFIVNSVIDVPKDSLDCNCITDEEYGIFLKTEIMPLIYHKSTCNGKKFSETVNHHQWITLEGIYNNLCKTKLEKFSGIYFKLFVK